MLIITKLIVRIAPILYWNMHIDSAKFRTGYCLPRVNFELIKVVVQKFHCTCICISRLYHRLDKNSVSGSLFKGVRFDCSLFVMDGNCSISVRVIILHVNSSCCCRCCCCLVPSHSEHTIMCFWKQAHVVLLWFQSAVIQCVMSCMHIICILVHESFKSYLYYFCTINKLLCNYFW